MFCGTSICWAILAQGCWEGARASMILGRVGVVYFSYYAKYVAPMLVHPSTFGFMVSIAALVVISLLTKRPSEKKPGETMTGLYIRPQK
jgi:sodium/proline symporter